jgi:hypothetical protein
MIGVDTAFDKSRHKIGQKLGVLTYLFYLFIYLITTITY